MNDIYSINKCKEIIGINMITFCRIENTGKGNAFIPPDKEEFNELYLNDPFFKKAVDNTLYYVLKEVRDSVKCNTYI